MTRLLAVAFAMLLATGPLCAAPRPYVLDAEGSTVAFATDFGTDQITGDFPVTLADLTLDFDKAANSKVHVILDVTGARASFPFAAQALKGPKVLDAANFPEMSFTSKSVRKSDTGATVSGDLTLRGVTRPMVLEATILRQQGTTAGDLSHLVVHLTGQIQRSAFGATGWSDMVGDLVRIDISARIHDRG